ncbi:MAG: RNA polymerase-binding protein DksA [Candidatus Contendobacter sp.]|nr:RNA polymerase-binding protein DksA [Candidatus Contendobacter sp.]
MGNAVAESDHQVLTEKDLLAMSDADYMNPAQLNFFRQRLTVMKRELMENAEVTGAHLRATEVAADPVDRATLEEEHALELRVRDRERKLLKKIESTLRQLDDGSYGYCEETGEPIGLKRLLARPTATLSLEAQERRENLQRVQRD